MIKYNSSESVLSYYNPIVALNPEVRKSVNDNFIQPIIQSFFDKIGGPTAFEELDSDKLISDIDFNNNNLFSSLVKEYLYNEIIIYITKNIEGKVEFKPRYIITFDEDLADFGLSDAVYPHAHDKKIKYGAMTLGNAVILYYIYINLQDLIRYIKKFSYTSHSTTTDKVIESELQKRNRLLNNIILKKENHAKNLANDADINLANEEIKRLRYIKTQELEGTSGKLRVNLTWNTTDDLDLSILTPSGEIIDYKNRTIEQLGIIGELDVDRNSGSDIVSNPQENINWDGFPGGLHKIFVNFYLMREKEKVPFTLSIIPQNADGRIYNDYVDNTGINQRKEIASFELKNGAFIFSS